jgi:hypothetical protein
MLEITPSSRTAIHELRHAIREARSRLDPDGVLVERLSLQLVEVFGTSVDTVSEGGDSLLERGRESIARTPLAGALLDKVRLAAAGVAEGVKKQLGGAAEGLPPSDAWGLCEEGIEPETRRFLHNAYLYAGFAKLGSKVLALDDFSPVTITLAKAFETEVNMSLVQWIRQRLGIALPGYFATHQPRATAMYALKSSCHGAVDFNAQRDGQWAPPALGATRLVIEEMTQAEPPPYWDSARWKQTLAAWARLQRLRNGAAHTELQDVRHLAELVGLFESFRAAGTFESMAKLKGATKAPVPVP